MMPGITTTPVCHGVEQINQTAASCVFDTKEEFIAHLIRTKEIKKDPRRYNDDMIHLLGTLKIDRRVKKGLNWNDVIATSAIVEKGMISRYQYLPRTCKGVRTSLSVPSLELYMFHNNFNAICKNGIYIIFVGSPCWWSTIAPPVGTFLTQYDFSGKTVIPFMTHGGSGFGHSIEDIQKLVPNARIGQGKAFWGARVTGAEHDVTNWIEGLKND